MSEPVTITLQGAPRGKGRPRFGQGRAYTDAATKAYEAALAWAAKQEMGGREPFAGPVQVTIGAFMEIPMSWSRARHQEAITGQRRPMTKPDADNIVKAALDAMNGIVFIDDKQVVEVGVIKKYSVQPALVVTVREA